MIIHIVMNDRALCGFTSNAPRHWSPETDQAVAPEEAHFSNCFACVTKLHARDELECREMRMNGYE